MDPVESCVSHVDGHTVVLSFGCSVNQQSTSRPNLPWSISTTAMRKRKRQVHAMQRSLLEFLTVVPSCTTATPCGVLAESRTKAEGAREVSNRVRTIKVKSHTSLVQHVEEATINQSMRSLVAIFSGTHRMLDGLIRNQIESILNSALRPLEEEFLKRRLWKSVPLF